MAEKSQECNKMGITHHVKVIQREGKWIFKPWVWVRDKPWTFYTPKVSDTMNVRFMIPRGCFNHFFCINQSPKFLYLPHCFPESKVFEILRILEKAVITISAYTKSFLNTELQYEGSKIFRETFCIFRFSDSGAAFNFSGWLILANDCSLLSWIFSPEVTTWMSRIQRSIFLRRSVMKSTERWKGNKPHTFLQ